MVDGQAAVQDLGLTESNRTLVSNFVTAVLIGCQLEKLSEYVLETYTEHNPRLMDGLESLRSALAGNDPEGSIEYHKMHHLLAEGDFVLTGCEGSRGNTHTSFYDLFRVSKGEVVEHWDTSETIPPRSAWKNENGHSEQ